MSDPREIRRCLREWILATGQLAPGELSDQTRIFADGLLESVHVMDLILLIEELSRREIDVEKLTAGAFRNVERIYQNFFAETVLYVD